MRIRADLNVNGGSRKLVLVAGENEKSEHLSLKLAAYILYWNEELTVDASSKHPALLGQEFRPDLLGTDITGSVSLWVECGHTSRNKIAKALRRWPGARVVLLQETEAQAKRLRLDFPQKENRDAARMDILSWPGTKFLEWNASLSEKTEVFGESTRTSMNLVVNRRVCLVDLVRA